VGDLRIHVELVAIGAKAHRYAIQTTPFETAAYKVGDKYLAARS
jgi:hypothetical protein